MKANNNSKTVRTPEEAHKAEMDTILYGEPMDMIVIESKEQLAELFGAAEAEGEDFDLTEFMIK